MYIVTAKRCELMGVDVQLYFVLLVSPLAVLVFSPQTFKNSE